VPAAPADDEGQLSLVVEEGRDPRKMDRCMRPDHARRLLVEEDGEGRGLEAGLLHVVGVVEPDGEELGRARDRGEELDVGS